MTEKKVCTPQIARETWEATEYPSSRRLKEKLEAAGYVTPSFKTLTTWMKDWPQPAVKPKHPSKPRVRKPKQKLDDASPVLTGDPRTKAEDVAQAVLKQLPPPDPEQPKGDEPKADAVEDELKRLKEAITGGDEALVKEAWRQTFATAIAFQIMLRHLAPTLLLANPDGAARAHLAAAESLDKAGAPLAQIGQLREQAMKTINGNGHTIIEPGADDPLADAIKHFKTAHAA